MQWLLLTHPLAALLFWYHVRWWIARDVAAFVADGAASSLRTVFHRQRLTWRTAFTVLVAAAASLPVVDNPWPYALSVVGLLALGTGWWAYAFNPGLNKARKLAYVSVYYVSYAAGAAYFPDGWLWARAYRQVYPSRQGVIHFPDAAVREAAGVMLKQVLRLTLAAGIGLYLLCGGLGLFIF